MDNVFKFTGFFFTLPLKKFVVFKPILVISLKFKAKLIKNIWGKLFGGTVPPNSTLFGGTPDFEKPKLVSK